MINWAQRLDVIDLYVEDVEGTKAFYEHVFGLAGTRFPDCVGFEFGDKILHLRDVSTADEFIAPARAASRQDGSRGIFTIFVADVPGAWAELTERGVQRGTGAADGATGSIFFADPSGQIWELAEDPVPDRQQPASAGGSSWANTPMQIGRIILFADDLDLAKSFYQDAFGLQVEQDGAGLGFRLDGLSVGLLGTAAAAELIGPAAVAAPDAGLRFTFCTFVDRVDAVCADLAVRGVRLFKDAKDLSFGHRLASLRDPGGHIWEIVAEVPAADSAKS
jgi:catechol 2,3-dioxygenase-like lactoylglutathione lyase family enzyme